MLCACRVSQASNWLNGEERRAQSDTVLPDPGCIVEQDAVEPTATSGPSTQACSEAAAPQQPSSSSFANTGSSRQGRQPLQACHGQQASGKHVQGGGGGGLQPGGVPDGLYDTAMQSDNRLPS